MQRGGIVLTSEELLYRYEKSQNKVKRLENKKRITNKSYLNTLDEKVLKQIDDIEKKLSERNKNMRKAWEDIFYGLSKNGCYKGNL